MTRREWMTALPLALACCGGNTGRRRLVVSAFPGNSANGLYVAQEDGHFARQGLEVDVRLSTSTPQSIPLLARGQYDVSFGGVSAAFLNAASGGLPLRIMAVLDKAQPNCGGTGTLYGRRTLYPKGLRDLRLLRGRRVAIASRNAVSGFFFDAMLLSAGMTLRDVELLEMRQPEAVAALVAGGIDAALCSHGETDLDALSSKIVKGLSVGEVKPNLQYSFAYYGRSLTEAGPEARIRFLTAYFQGARDYDRGRIPKALSQLTSGNASTAAQSVESCHFSVAATESLDAGSLEQFAEWALRNGYCRRKPDTASILDAAVLAEAQRRFRSAAG